MSKKISFFISDSIFTGLMELPFVRKFGIENLFKACAINRMIDRGYLDEFGIPILFPKFEFDSKNVDFSNKINSDISYGD